MLSLALLASIPAVTLPSTHSAAASASLHCATCSAVRILGMCNNMARLSALARLSPKREILHRLTPSLWGRRDFLQFIRMARSNPLTYHNLGFGVNLA